MQASRKKTGQSADKHSLYAVRGQVPEKTAAMLETALFRTVRCPSCHYPLLEVYGRNHYYIRVKCQKCKFTETIDTAFFRTVHR